MLYILLNEILLMDDGLHWMVWVNDFSNSQPIINCSYEMYLHYIQVYVYNTQPARVEEIIICRVHIHSKLNIIMMCKKCDIFSTQLCNIPSGV